MPTADLPEWLETLDGPALEHLVVLRPDVLLGAPVRDLADLADRLTHPASVATVLRELPTPALQALEVITALGAGASSATVAALLDRGARSAEDHLEAVAGWVEHLVACALVWPDGGDRLRPNPGVLVVLDTPLDLGVPGVLLVGQTSAAELQKVARRWGLDVPKRKAELADAVLTELGDAAFVRRVAGAAPSGVTEVLLDRSAAAVVRMGRGWSARGPYGDDDTDEPALPAYLSSPAAFGQYRVAATWAIDNGLAYGPRFDPYDAQLPTEVLLALADPGARAPFAPEPPSVPTAPVAPERVAAEASSALTELMSTVMAVLEHLSRTPVPLLKTRGVGARELTRLGKAVGGAAPDVRLALELTAHVGLLQSDDAGRLGVGEDFARWRSQVPARRAVDLLQAWADLPYAPTEERDADGKAMPALSRLDVSDAAVAARAMMLGVLQDLPDGAGATSSDAVAGAATWRLPVVVGGSGTHTVRLALAEAERLGLVALGALSAVGRTMLAGGGGEDLTAGYAGMLPEVQTRAVVGSDLTVVVMGSPAPEVVDLLDAVAHREARGQASTWRLSPVSVREALDAGYEVDDMLSALRRVAGGDLPQALEYLVHDVARRHGHMSVRPAAAVVLSPDEALTAQVAADRSLRRLGLHAVAPTVVVASAPVAEVLAGLRAAGYLPVEVQADGAPVVALQRLAAPADRHGSPDDDAARGAMHEGPASDGTDPAAPVLDDADAALSRWAEDLADLADAGPHRTYAPHAPESPDALVSRLLRGEAPPVRDDVTELERVLTHEATRLAPFEVHQLAHAVTHGLAVRIRYRSRTGGVTVRMVSDLEVRHGYLIGWCHLREDARSFVLSSILGVIAEPG